MDLLVTLSCNFVLLFLHTDPHNITSVFPNHPHVYKSTDTYAVPVGFTDVVFTCNVIGWPPPIVEWHGGREKFSYSTSSTSGRFTSALLNFERGFTSFDTGRYSCIAEANNSESYSASVILVSMTDEETVRFAPNACSVTSETAYFQIRVFDTDCSAWDENFKGQIASDFKIVLVSAILSQCPNCLDVENALLMYAPKCSELLVRAAVFRGEVTTEHVRPTENVYCALNTWQAFGPSALITGKLKRIDRDCTFQLGSLSSECSGPTDSFLLFVVAGSSGALVILIVILLLIVISICALWKKRYI